MNSMKNGYYLSTYIEINSIANLYEIGERHDQNISLWYKEGENINLVHYWELERVTGKKHHKLAFYDLEQAKLFINKLLSRYNITIDDMVDVWGTPQLQTCNNYHSLEDIQGFTYHGLCHLFSAIMLDTDKFYNSNILGLAVDFGSDIIMEPWNKDKSPYVGGVVKEGNIELFNVFSPGHLWAAAKKVFGLEEGSLMALASASKSKVYFDGVDVTKVREYEWVDAISFINGLVEKVESITEEDEGQRFNGFDPAFSLEENRISMVMKEVQAISIRIMEKNIDWAIEKFNLDTGKTYLAISGGYALNCPSNSHLMKKYEFKGFIAPACVSDTGQSLGVAMYAFYKNTGKFNFKMKDANFGDRDGNLDVIISEGDYSIFIKNISDFSPKQAVEDIKISPVVWFEGAAEVGPRALGGRSLIADPRFEVSKTILNEIKKRQWWRPVAPIILEEDMNEWFEHSYESPFMLHTFNIKEDKVRLIPAIAHLDNSARVQTIAEYTKQKLLYETIKAFKEDTGVPIICNTSLNDKGEPIINSLAEAFNFALRKRIKIIYADGKRIELYNHDKYFSDKPLKRPMSIVKSEDERNLLIQQHNPHNLPLEVMLYCVSTNARHEDCDLTNKITARELSIRTKKFMKWQCVDRDSWHKAVLGD